MPLYDKDLVYLGLVYGVHLCGKHVAIQITFPSREYEYQDGVIQEIQSVLEDKGYVQPKIRVVWDPPWNEGMSYGSQ